ncbi:hypothetical protein BSU04_04215 [Caballeronia sordidicola]|uniref:Uncharacterized protein n=2 Tax=Caballeronia sordidicola TaxID=196367 RepID=A0A226X984_CABSO|nr:hypothetical protein BSU04_04215 [Caballeronia sordidicola]
MVFPSDRIMRLKITGLINASEPQMNRILFAPGVACLLFVSSANAQFSQDTPNSAIAQNFQYINHPPAAPVQASAPAATGRGHGHRHQQASTDADQIQ